MQHCSEISELFLCLIGVRQGENLSPFLFSIFLNDLENYFNHHDGEPLAKVRDKLETELHIFYKILVILYADDIVILSETKGGMLNDIFQTYCKLWQLKVNVNKTKVIIFLETKIG